MPKFNDGATDFEFVHINGQFIGRKLNLEALPPTPGVDGRAFRKFHTAGRSYDVIAIRDFDTAAAALTALQSYRGLISKALAATDNFNQTHNVICLNVERRALRPCITYVGGLATTPTVELEVVFTLIAQEP